jgi:hypothetical protein
MNYESMNDEWGVVGAGLAPALTGRQYGGQAINIPQKRTVETLRAASLRWAGTQPCSYLSLTGQTVFRLVLRFALKLETFFRLILRFALKLETFFRLILRFALKLETFFQLVLRFALKLETFFRLILRFALKCKSFFRLVLRLSRKDSYRKLKHTVNQVSPLRGFTLLSLWSGFAPLSRRDNTLLTVGEAQRNLRTGNASLPPSPAGTTHSAHSYLVTCIS